VPIDWRTLALIAPLAALWGLLTGGDPASWVIGLPAVVAAAWAGRRLGGDGGAGLSLIGVLRFLPFFFWESLRGGVDVAMRTLAPRLRVAPGFSVYTMRLKRREARVFFANCVCLLPGTLAVELDKEQLELHLLNRESDPSAELRRLERAVARVYRDQTRLENL
jgi:multicomponent Na+:H+ antiporter subunit E